MKIIDILVAKANGTLEDGFMFEFGKEIYRYNKGMDKILNGHLELSDTYTIENYLNDEVKVIEQNKKIEELEISEDNRKYFTNFVVNIADKLNELVKEVNKLIKEREEK